MKKILLKGRGNGHVEWRKATAFFQNPRGVLVHRVKHGETIIYQGSVSHHHVTYWCGNVANCRGLRGWIDTPDESAVLCTRCEGLAVAAGNPSADELVGRHVHVGYAKAVRTCCGGESKSVVKG